MSASEPDDTPAATVQLDGAANYTARPLRLGHGLRRGVGVLAGLLALAVVGVLAYNMGTRYFALNGAWYGPLQVQVGPGRISLEAYMHLATGLNGSLSGSGAVCYQNPLGGGTTSIDLKVTGNRSAGQVTLAFAISTATLGISVLNIALGPELDLHGAFTTSPSNTPLTQTPLRSTLVAGILVNSVATTVTLTGGNSAFPVTLATSRGVRTQFTAACAARATRGDRGDAADTRNAGN